MSHSETNRRIVLASRPKGTPAPGISCSSRRRCPRRATARCCCGRSIYRSIPTCARMMNERAPVVFAIHRDRRGDGWATVNRVVSSRNPRFNAGDLVLGNAGWQELAVSRRKGSLAARRSRTTFARTRRARHAVVHRVRGIAGHRTAEARRDRGRGRRHRRGRCRRRTDREAQGRARRRHRRRAGEVPITPSSSSASICASIIASRISASVSRPPVPKASTSISRTSVAPCSMPCCRALNVGARIPLCGFIASYNDENLPPGPNRVPLLQSTLLRKASSPAGLHHPRPLRHAIRIISP